jgi:hypothetical protein
VVCIADFLLVVFFSFVGFGYHLLVLQNTMENYGIDYQIMPVRKEVLEQLYLPIVKNLIKP